MNYQLLIQSIAASLMINQTESNHIEPMPCKTNNDCDMRIENNEDMKVICDSNIEICIIIHEQQHYPSNSWGDIDPNNDESNSTSSILIGILTTLPFISIILIGIVCAKTIQSKNEQIEANLVQTPINGIPIEELLNQHDLFDIDRSLVAPPSYEKATGQIPPSYETALQMVQERHPSLFMTLNPPLSPPSVSSSTIDSISSLNHHYL